MFCRVQTAVNPIAIAVKTSTLHFMNQFAKIFTELEFNPLLLNDNASESDIQNLEKRLACKLPSEILALLRNHNGMKFSGVFPFRLMSITETLDLCDFFEWQENLKRNLEDAERICLFWDG